MKKGAIAIVLILIVAMSIYAYVQVKKLIDAEWKFAGVKLKELNLARLVFDLSFDIDNKGGAEVTVSEQQYDVLINGRLVSKVTKPEAVKIGARQTSRMPLTIAIHSDDFKKALGSNWQSILLWQPEKMLIRITGSFSMTAGIISLKRFPFDTSYTLNELIA